ncbi:YdcF family protein [Amorphus coralli]|uniref:YdcF family protein n=1 Tax=Amorphus coralli TaxID=340680 RepID=UPI0003FC6A1E|nr:YdcF family protein [Amorphus coralli]
MLPVIDSILRFLVTPSNAIVVVLAVGLILLVVGRHRSGLGLAGLGAVLIVLFGYTTLGLALLRPLEDRFQPSPTVASDPRGIIILGGAINAAMMGDGRPISISGAGDRFTVVAGLARRFPDAKIFIASGGSPADASGATELSVGKRLLQSFGVEGSRISGDIRSATTWDNARFAREALLPQTGETWILVTSAWHMPRAVGAFRRAGWGGLVPWPVDYQTRDGDWPGLVARLSAGLGLMDAAAHEWLGLLAYRLRGRSNDLFPGPEPAQEP